MKIYVVCDLEGVAGVIDHHQQCQWDVAKGWYAPYLAQARRLATLELNALVEGALEGGASEVVAWDGHGNFPGALSPQKAQAVIRAAAKQAMSKIGTIMPYQLAPPFRLRAQFTAERFAEQWARQPNVRRLDAVTVEMEPANQPWLLL